MTHTDPEPVYLGIEELNRLMEESIFFGGDDDFFSDDEVDEAIDALEMLHTEMADLANMVRADAYVPKHAKVVYGKFSECYDCDPEVLSSALHGMGAQE